MTYKVYGQYLTPVPFGSPELSGKQLLAEFHTGLGDAERFLVNQEVQSNYGSVFTIEHSDNCDTVTIPRTEYKHLLWLTTPQTIETAPKRGKNILLSNGRIWKQGYHHDSDGWVGVENPTHWQHLPIIQKSEGAK